MHAQMLLAELGFALLCALQLTHKYIHLLVSIRHKPIVFFSIILFSNISKYQEYVIISGDFYSTCVASSTLHHFFGLFSPDRVAKPPCMWQLIMAM